MECDAMEAHNNLNRIGWQGVKYKKVFFEVQSDNSCWLHMIKSSQSKHVPYFHAYRPLHIYKPQKSSSM